MDTRDLQTWTTEHRLIFADTVDALGEDHAGDPTLCEGWDVRTLTGHMLQPILVPSWRFLLTAAAAWGEIVTSVRTQTWGTRPVTAITPSRAERYCSGVLRKVCQPSASPPIASHRRRSVVARCMSGGR